MNKILAISGSLKKDSSNKRILYMIREMNAGGADIEIYEDLDKLPFFNPDLDKDEPPGIIAEFRHKIQTADAVIICTPEYVFSLPGVLKNALEWMVSSGTFSGKPVALITAAASGIQAHHSLQLIMKTIEATFDEDSCLLIQGAKGKVSNAEVQMQKQLQNVMDTLMNEIGG